MKETKSNNRKTPNCSTAVSTVSNTTTYNNSNNVANIPLDLIIDILSRLPVKPCIRFKSVCKSWYSLIRTPGFAKIHFTRSKMLTSTDNNNEALSIVTAAFDPETGIYTLWLQFSGNTPHLVYNIETCRAPRILGICDGLFCATFGDGSDTVICNPTTGGPVFRTPRFGLPVSGESDSVFYAVGGVQTHDSHDLFLVRAFYSPACLGFRGEMYLVSVGVWREIEVKRGEGIDDRTDLCSVVFFNSPPVAMNGVFYRRAYVSNVPCVVSFQVNGYVFDTIACPGDLIRRNAVRWHLVNFDGELGLLFPGPYNKECFKMWVLNEIDGSWSIKFRMESLSWISRSLHVLGCTKNDNFVVQHDLPNSEVELFTYDPKSLDKTCLPFTGLKKGRDFYLYSESLLSL